MTQTRYWNYKDDDSTFSLNWRDLILIPTGLYSGFDGEFNGGLSLTLTHDETAKRKVKQDLSYTNYLGIWKTTQGALIIEDESIDLNISTGDVNNPRIDLIVGEHTYLETTGGSVALYKVIEGVPSSNPVAPALTNPEKQIALGTLYVPSGMTDLNSTGVKYTKSRIPTFSDDGTVMHTDKEQIVTHLKVFHNTKGKFIITTIDTATNKIIIPELSNYYVIEDLNNVFDPYQLVDGFSTPLGGGGHEITFHTNDSIKLKSTYGNGGTLSLPSHYVHIQGNSNFKIIDLTGVQSPVTKHLLLSGSEAYRTVLNKFTGAQVFGKSNLSASTTTVSSIKYIKLPDDHNSGNFCTINVSTSASSVTCMHSFSAYSRVHTDIADEAGGILYLQPNATLELKHDSNNVAAKCKKLHIPTGADFQVPANSILMFIEDTDTWRLLSVWDSTHSVITLAQMGITDLTDVDTSTLTSGEVLIYDGSFWENVDLKTFIETSNPKMKSTIEEKSTVYNQFAQIPFVGIGSGVYGISLSGVMGNTIDFSGLPSSTSADVLSALPASFQDGTELTLIFGNGAFNVSCNAITATTSWLPIRRFSRNITQAYTFTTMLQSRVKVKRIGNMWVWMEDNLRPNWNQLSDTYPDYIVGRPTTPSEIGSFFSYGIGGESFLNCLIAGKVSSAGARLGYWGEIMIAGYPFSSSKVATGQYYIGHNIGHQNYGVLVTSSTSSVTYRVTNEANTHFWIMSNDSDNSPTYFDSEFYFIVFKLN